MKITQLGHASLYIETADIRLLMDPVLTDTHQEGLLEVFPRRQVNWERLPPFEILFISHQHLDHFDIATLAKLPREVQVIIPHDQVIASALNQLGFASVVSIDAYQTFEIDSTWFLATPSRATHPEHGLVIRDPDGTFWNQVDTLPGPEQVDLVLKKAGAIDFLLATWQPMLELEWQYNRPMNFPWNAYGALLEITRQIQPGFLAPGSNGYRYMGASAWLNHVVFPQTRERYCADVQVMIPSLSDRIFEFDPGDVIEFVNGEATLHRRASDFVVSEDRDPFELEFNPITAQRSLRDFSLNGNVDQRPTVTNFIERSFPEFINAHPQLFRHHREWGMVYQIEVAAAEDSEYFWCDFSSPQISFHQGRNPQANFSCGITLSGLAGLINGTGGWDSVAMAGNFYQIHRLYGIWQRGIVLPAVAVSNPLHLMFSDEDVTEQLIQNEIRRVSVAENLAVPSGVEAATDDVKRKEVDTIAVLQG